MNDSNLDMSAEAHAHYIAARNDYAKRQREELERLKDAVTFWKWTAIISICACIALAVLAR